MKKPPFLTLAALPILCLTSQIQGQTLASGVTLNYDANDPLSGIDSANWNSLTANSTKDMDFGADVTLVGVASGQLTNAYRFTGGAADTDNGSWDTFDETVDTTWELWIQPGDTGAADQTLFESGAAGDGIAIWYQVGTESDGSGTVNFTIDNGATDRTVSAVINTTDFRHITCVYDRDIDTGAGVIDLMQIWVDGVLIDDNDAFTTFDDATDSSTDALNDWAGGDGAGVANISSGTAAGSSGGPYTGDISVLRFWEGKALSPAEITGNYDLLSGPDTFAPEVFSYSPADDDTNAPLGDLELIFNESLVVLTGDIRIVNESDTVTTTIAIGDPQVTVAGNTITISPTIALIGGKDYYVEIDAGVVEDEAGNDFAGILNDTTWNFSTDGIPPTLDTFANDKPGGQAYDNSEVIFTVTFSEAMNASTIEAADFSNSGTAEISVDSVTQISDSVYEVAVLPTSSGSLQLQINASANLEDVAGNALVTTSAIQDPTVIDVLAFVPNSGALALDFQETVASEEFDAVDTTWGATTPGRFWHISVNPNNVGYASYIALDTANTPIPPYIRNFSNPVVGWSFIGGGANGDLTISEESGGIVTWTTTDETDPVTNTFDSFGMNQKKFWNATDPGPDFNVPVDEAGVSLTTHDTNVTGYRSFGQATATIDISGLSSGKVIFFYGAFSATPQVDAILRDSSGLEPDIVLTDLHTNGDAAQRTEYYAAEVSFDTGGGVYDTIVHNYLQPGTEPDGSGNGRSGGLVVLGQGSGYGNWVSGPFAGGTLTDSTPTLDFDSGGLDTGIEWVVGGDPTDGSDDPSVAPTLSNDDETFFTFNYRISDGASEDANTTVVVEYGNDLVGWTTAVDNEGTIEIITADGTGADEGFDIVTVQIDRTLATEGVLFARLNVVVAP